MFDFFTGEISFDSESLIDSQMFVTEGLRLDQFYNKAKKKFFETL